MTSYKEKLNLISTFLFDVDGVLTNGDVMLLHNEVVRTLNSRDAYAIQYAIKNGYKVFVITGGRNKAVKERLEDLGVTEVRMQASNKIKVYDELREQYGFSDAQVLYMGDDIPDHQVMEVVGVSACPQDAAVEIKAMADYQSPYNGGRHCVRDVIEQTLRVQGVWFNDKAHLW